MHYNEDRLVIASRDYGGDRYAMDLDEASNLTGITLPDGNKLAFKYDDFSRLIEETDPLGRKIRYEHHLGTRSVTEASYPDGSVWKARYDDKATC
ncbi:YD repeat-containing protein [Pseudomonas graminis]|uniref:YD repeat-containing protein n=1 Tax=Pseudomonas graminis TaxID=158627 RepID=A0A1I0ES34_9PSED|nr:YD repeat-containing protein [Pseudomonas graminis]